MSALLGFPRSTTAIPWKLTFVMEPKEMHIFRIAALLELSLTALEALNILKDGLLPLGGGHIQQVGIVFAIAFAIVEFMNIFNNPES